MDQKKESHGRSPESRYFRDDREQGLARKRHQEGAGWMLGLVEVPGPLPPHLEEEIRNLAARCQKDETRHGKDAEVLAVTPFAGGLAIETRGEKLAQRIADALRRSRHAQVERSFDDEGRRRILTCKLPGVQPEGPGKEG
ncbi:MAG TPA: hypothetical protein VFY93_03480 [Planctomycetota bacterium]|nr:hypothetical protein [Planctomycetota bacterium]